MIVVIGDGTPSIPPEFQATLQQFDKDLLLAWHHPPAWPKSRPGMWKIEQCIEHHGSFALDGNPQHDHTCRRSYVWMVRDEDGVAMPLGDAVIDHLRAMRAHSESYGSGERALRNFIAASNRLDDDLENKREERRKEIMDYNGRLNRRQLNQAHDLIQRHDMRPNK